MTEPLQLVRDQGTPVPGPREAVESFEEFVETNHARLYGALCLLTRDRYEAEDIAQEAFVRILERWDRVRSIEEPAGYLFKTAMNVLRKRRRRALVAMRRITHLARRDEGFEQIEDRDVVVRAIATLPSDQRAAVIVTSLLGYPSEEAARILGIEPSNVRTRATRARAALRAAIGEER